MADAEPNHRGGLQPDPRTKSSSTRTAGLFASVGGWRDRARNLGTGPSPAVHWWPGDIVLDLVAPPPATVSGVVRGAGVPIAYNRVEALDAATGDLLAAAWTDDAGSYSVSDVRAGSAGFVVRVIWSQDPAIRAERSGIVLQVNESIVDFDLDLPLGLVTGQVTFDGGVEPVPYPNVRPGRCRRSRTSYAIVSGRRRLHLFVGSVGTTS
jgi:hypothetical protein